MLQSVLRGVLPHRAILRHRLFLSGSLSLAHHTLSESGSESCYIRTCSNETTILSNLIRQPPSTTAPSKKTSQERASAKKPRTTDADARESQSTLRTKKKCMKDDYHAESKIRDAIKVAIYGILHHHHLKEEQLMTLNALANINGYKPVHIEDKHQQGRVQLSEGVIADAHKKVNEEITIYARPSRRRRTSRNDESAPAAVTEKDHPPFLEEDFTLYRIMEQSVEEWLHRMENGVKEWYRAKVDTAKRAVDRAYTPMSNLIARNSRLTTTGDDDDDANNVKKDIDPQPKHVDENNDVTTTTSCLTTVAVDNEDILVLSKKDNRSLLLEDVPPQYRLLVLPESSSFQPYNLRHGRSGTVIYTGLVLFGAVPLTYRSLKYAMDYAEYPAVANTMIASVVLSVSYSLWASYFSARTRQLLAVSSAVSSRIVARDDGSKAILVEEACEGLADAVMYEYFSREGIGREDETKKLVGMPLCDGLDPVAIALDLGLLRGKDAADPDLVAVDFATVSSEIMARVFAQHKIDKDELCRSLI
mmetsp:Transcript_32154/g.58930  ORF Transcript_32154/g.58930 Transcript_32154/m.58930 type:complete len:532 (-) Transcript_32154:904-2499(-)|eukprot:CAMPEP_0201627618 /NCGR_PEP_ID=MMETSP0493-20130528/2753_1 /ASSEMBLY_ACC=CAM_ASM_000838 /TAXON_ID=420259 /ORGANISM="Thalassiosira gravida, Strain GMp14c1" /LENGTH=531 /DNA_ID=CAMNT_0048098123 /DNA_START=136 /DNA_END=1731 /DNA_ORIENTATION=-